MVPVPLTIRRGAPMQLDLFTSKGPRPAAVIYRFLLSRRAGLIRTTVREVASRSYAAASGIGTSTLRRCGGS